jgi:ribosomal protein S18 acetylase RimI-like enzyme
MSSEPETAFRIRPVSPAEYEALGELTVTAYHAIGSTRPPQAAYDAELRDAERRATTSCVLVAVDSDGTLLGGVTYVSGPEDPFSEELHDDEAGIRMLAVAPFAQRRGVGRALTLECLRRGRAAGKRRIVLHTGPWMPNAIRLYESLGFVRAPELDFTPVPDIDLLAYVFELG